MKIKLFTKENCPKCPAAKELFNNMNGIEIERYDVDNVKGLAEASYYSVMSTPSIIIVNNNDDEIKSYRGEIPTKEELLSVINES